MKSLRIPLIVLLFLGLGAGAGQPAAGEWFDCFIPPPEDVEQESEELWNNITWTPPELEELWGITVYNIYRAVWDTVITEGYEYIDSVDYGINTYTDLDIIPGVTYSYIVTAVSPCGEGSPSVPTMPPYPNCEVVDMYQDRNETLGLRVTPQPWCLFPPPLPHSIRIGEPT